MKQKLCLLGCLILFQFYARAQVTAVTITGSQVQKITSNIVSGQEYALEIMLPADYGKTNKKYPVIYLMDSQWDFPLVTALYGQQYYDGFVPSAIIVGVTWTGKYANPDSLRARDYTPSPVKQTIQSGGADRFLAFMRKELFPFIESRYSADKDNRILMGCSLGGLFTLYTLFTQPDLFRYYVAASPAINWDNEIISRAEIKYFENRSKPAARLYLCEGGVEKGVPLYENFVRHLSKRGYNNLQIKSQVLENIGHSGTKGEGYERGMQFVFERPSVALTATQIKDITGHYQSDKGHKVEIRVENNAPVLYFGGSNQDRLHAANETELYSTAQFLNLHLKRENESITGFVLERYGSSELFSKIK
jgi:predicted alpha/beta superfamily hydrolase